MNLLRIAVKELKHDFRDRWNLMFMLAFPLTLMLILGFSLGSTFGVIAQVGEIRVLVRDSGDNPALSDSFAAFAAGVTESGVQFDDWQEGTEGRTEVEQDLYDSYVELSSSGIHIYSSSRNSLKSDIFQGMMLTFGDRYTAVQTISQTKDAARALQILDDAKGSSDYVREVSVVAERQPGALDYYALAMSCMVALWGAWSASNLIGGERRWGTASRLTAAPITKFDIFTGKVLGSLVTNMLCVSIVVFVSKYVFGAYWGDHMPAVLTVLFSEVVLAVSLGLTVSYIFNQASSRSVLMIITQLAAFFGGAYVAIGVDEDLGIFHWVTNLSPIRWANVALTRIVYAGQIASMWPVVFLNLGLAVIMLAAAAAMMRRKEGL